MNISYNWLRELVALELAPAELRERLTMVGLEVEALHQVEDGDVVLEIAVLSNRADWLSHLGVAREASVIAGQELRLSFAEPAARSGRTEDFTSVEVQAPALCPRFTARVIHGVKIGPSPAWLAGRLRAVGQRPINNVADITNYVMLELGQPLHAFDLDKLTERRIIVRRAREGENVTTLDGVKRQLDPDMLVIADAARAVAVAGVMGGAETEISEQTRNVLIECAYFTPASIRRTSKMLGLSTDASVRFERGVDYEGQPRAQTRVAALIGELAGGTATEDLLDVYPSHQQPATITLRLSRVHELMGVEVAPRESLRILGALGFRPVTDVIEVAEDVRLVSPTWRTDIQLEEDVVEEVARHAGYELIEATLPPSRIAGEHRAHEDRRRAARRALAGCGFDEALNFSFIDATHDEQFALMPDLINQQLDHGEHFVTLTNPIIEGLTRMRPTLLPGLLQSVRHNFNHGTRDVRLYEMGRVFASPAKAGGRPVELESLALVATGGAHEEGVAAAPRELDFYDLKGALEAASDAMNLPSFAFSATEARHLREGQAAAVWSEGRSIGYLGRLTDELAGGYKFRQPIFVAEVNLGAVLDGAQVEVRYTPLARYPSVVRDLTLLAERRATFAQMREVALGLNVEHAREVSLVYVYEGERVPADRRSVTLRIEYRADERTLRDEEVDGLHRQIVNALEEAFAS